MSPDAKLLATGDGEGMVRFWDMRDGALLASVKAHDLRVRSLKFSPDGRLLATSGDDDRVRLWDVSSGERLAQVTQTTATTCDSIAFDPSGRTLAVPMDDNSIVLASVPELREQARLGRTRGQIVSVAYLPDGRAIAAASRDLGIYLMPTDGGRVKQLKPPGPPWTLAFTPDGARMVSGSWNKSVEVWDMPSGTILTTLRGHSALISAVTFFPANPDVVASSATDGTVRLWDGRSGLALATLEAFGGWDALSVSISPDGRRIAAGAARGEAVIWDTAYFDRHIAGNAEYQLTRLLPALGEAARPDKVRAWAAAVQARAHERWSPPLGLPGVDPAAVAAWGAAKKERAAGP
jgi:WD40 repeat protein